VFFANKTGSFCDGQGRLAFLGEEAFQERVVSNAKVIIFLENKLFKTFDHFRFKVSLDGKTQNCP
jgi:hypothetical protein